MKKEGVGGTDAATQRPHIGRPLAPESPTFKALLSSGRPKWMTTFRAWRRIKNAFDMSVDIPKLGVAIEQTGE